MKITAKIVLQSVSPEGEVITTMQLCYPRFIHSELMTHRVFSRNAMSSRAIPIQKMIDQVRSSPAAPIHWGSNQPGMQAHAEVENKALAASLWMLAAVNAANVAERMMEMGLHKQVANRILEPFQWMNTIVTSTEWWNWDELRCHKDADPNIQALAEIMREARLAENPRRLRYGEWHLPYVSELENLSLEDAKKASAARCARVSYLTHDGSKPALDKDLELFERLAGSHPRHSSPLEHQATPGEGFCGNFVGWNQHRKYLEAETNGN